MRGLYVITDPNLLPEPTLLPRVEQALIGGAVLVQYRDKTGSTEQRVRRATALKSLCDRYGVKLVINDDLTLAAQLGVGVHIGRDDASINTARKRLGPEAIVGASCYNAVETAISAIEAGASYVAFGRFFPSATKPGEIYVDQSVIEKVKLHYNVPVAAIGGITIKNAPEVIAAGADLIAVINGVFGQQATETAAREYAQLFR